MYKFKKMSAKVGVESVKVSESSFEYLLGELLNSKDPLNVVLARLDRIGYDVGYRIVESIVEKHKFNSREPVDLVKFICKEFWEELYGKKMDKLQANNKGCYLHIYSVSLPTISSICLLTCSPILAIRSICAV